jgi:molecular chaperone DnaK (HSP70)
MSNHIFGIDRGTTYSVIARINVTGRPEVIKDRERARPPLRPGSSDRYHLDAQATSRIWARPHSREKPSR